MEMMIKCLYLSLILFLIAWAVQAYDQTTDNLLSPNFTDGSWTGTNQTSRHGDDTIAGIDGKYVESSINLNDYLTKEEINGGFSSTLGADIWFWNTTEQNVIMKQTLVNDNGISITQQRQISGDCINYNGCTYDTYTDTIIVGGNSQQDYKITARFEFNESTGSPYHNAADLKNPSLTVSYYENFTKPEPIELDTKWKDTLEEEYKMDYVVEEFKLDDFMFLKEDTEMFILEETTEEFDKEFEEVEILQAFGGPEIVEEPKEQEDKEIDSTVAIQDDTLEEVMEDEPKQTEETFVATDGQQLESEPSSNEQVAVDVQDVQTQVAVKIKAIDKQLAATNIMGAQLIEAQQVDLSSYNKSYTDNRKIYEGNTYEDFRTLDEYSKKIYNDSTKFVAISMNDPVRKYQEKLRDATIKRQMAERELRQLRGY